jgi:hypothetical protein
MGATDRLVGIRNREPTLLRGRTVRSDDAFAPAATLEAHRDADDQRLAVEPGLRSLDHAALAI